MRDDQVSSLEVTDEWLHLRVVHSVGHVSNEELVASNEELQSTNEELQSAKEELQSTNEELTTVNDELRNRK